MSDTTLSSSLEDYLEAIYMIALDKRAARAKDIADRMKVHRSSVTNALRMLKKYALVNYAPYDIITLTAKGERMGEEIARRHEVLRDFFVKVLAIEKGLADETACQMEHSVSKEVLDRFIRFVDYVEACPRGGAKWIKGFGYYCTEGCSLEDCERCVEDCLDGVRVRKQQQEAGAVDNVVALDTLRPGEKVRVSRIKGDSPFARRIRAMGVTPGTVIEVEKVAPLGDPVDIKVRGYHLSLRKEDLRSIEAKALAPALRQKKGSQP